MISSLRRLSPHEPGAHYFFGYYDVPAYSSDSTLHLAHRVEFWERRPAAEDEAPIAHVERQGCYALSINFSCMFDFRPDYGYAGIADP